jgi:soluble lytic murein transglycosylase-like protein
MKEFFDWCRTHTAMLVTIIVAQTVIFFWSFNYHRDAYLISKDVYQISEEAFTPYTVTLEELLTLRIKKTNPKLPDAKVEKYVEWIVKYAPRNGLDPFLIVGVISTESFWNERLISTANCRGLMQVNYRVWRKELRQFGINTIEDLNDPEKNIQAGCYILGFYMAKFKGNTIKALQGFLGSQQATWYSERVAKYSIK